MAMAAAGYTHLDCQWFTASATDVIMVMTEVPAFNSLCVRVSLTYRCVLTDSGVPHLDLCLAMGVEDGWHRVCFKGVSSLNRDETVLCEVKGAEARILLWSPVLSLDIVYPLLQPVFVIEGEPDKKKAYHIVQENELNVN